MPTVSLPKRKGPKFGTFAFDPSGEELIYRAVTVHGMTKIQVAAKVGVTLPTMDAIMRRVEARLAGPAKENAPAPPSRESEA